MSARPPHEAPITDPVLAWRLLGPSPAPSAAELRRVAERYPVRIPPYYAGLLEPSDASDPLARMVLPDPAELRACAALQADPLAEERHTVAPRLVHRYRDRALLLVTHHCASYCRHCTRKRLVGRGGAISDAELQRALAYLRAHPEVRDVLVSGGDPFTLPERRLHEIVAALREVRSLELVRVGTRVPAVDPARVTPSLADGLRGDPPVYVSTHFNHPRELTAEARRACALLADAGLPLANQTVLLAGVNDRSEIIEELCRKLLRARVRPYYLLQCDLSDGVEHLRTPLARGIAIMEALRGRLSGLGLPTFVVDGPHGAGKMPLSPCYLVSWGPGRAVLRNFEGLLVSYPDPVVPVAQATARDVRVGGAQELGGVAGVLSGEAALLVPGELERRSRMDGES